MGEKSAEYLKLIERFAQYERTVISRPQYFMPETAEGAEYMHSVFHGMETEVLYMFCMDANFRLLAVEEIAQGKINAAEIDAQRIIRRSLKYEPKIMVLAHNHPSGGIAYSKADELATQKLAETLKTLEIKLTDHYIVTETELKGILTGTYMRG